jgi:ATP-dependent helicase/DNAse subunit B
MRNRKFGHSASSLAAFKACPVRFQLAYDEGVRLDVDPDNLRQGTNWHALLETYQQNREKHGHDAAFDAAVNHLNERYTVVPDNKTPFEWETERTWLTMAFIAYCWKYEGEHYETLVTEHHFEVPIINPDTGRPDRILPKLRGKIDRLCKVGDRIMAVEYKTTGSPIDSDSDYWLKLRLDTQVSVYSYAAMRDGWQVQGTLYDVLRKPRSKPRLLTQAEVKRVIKDGEWYGGPVAVKITEDDEGKVTQVWANGVETTEIKNGAKGWQFRETPEMFGFRLLHDMYENPDNYFARKEIARTTKELRQFEVELYNIAVTIGLMRRLDNFYHNEQSCDNPYPCQYKPICLHGRTQAVLDGETPKGFKRIYNEQTTPAPTS